MSDTISMGDAKWTDYVLSKLEADELQDEYPTVNGLRRVVEDLLNMKLNDSETHVIQGPQEGNHYTSTVVCRLHFVHRETGDTLRVSGAADAVGSTLQGPFKAHPTAIAETRAEGRALRRALKLKTLVSEEVETPEVDEADKKIESTQVNMINILCRPDKLKLNPKLVVLHVLDKDVDVDALTFEEGRRVIAFLTEAQRNAIEIPEQIKL